MSIAIPIIIYTLHNMKEINGRVWKGKDMMLEKNQGSSMLGRNRNRRRRRRRLFNATMGANEFITGEVNERVGVCWCVVFMFFFFHFCVRMRCAYVCVWLKTQYNNPSPHQYC